MINEATGVDLITVTSGYRVSYKSLEKEHNRAVIQPKIIAITIPRLTLPRDKSVFCQNILVIDNSKSFINTSIAEGKRSGLPIISEATSQTTNQNSTIKNILSGFFKLRAIVEIVAWDGVSNASRSNGIHCFKEVLHSIFHFFAVQICNIALRDSIFCNVFVCKDSELLD